MLNISETVRGRVLVPTGPPIGNGLWGIKWSCDWWCHVTPKRSNSWPQYALSAMSGKQLEILLSNNR